MDTRTDVRDRARAAGAAHRRRRRGPGRRAVCFTLNGAAPDLHDGGGGKLLLRYEIDAVREDGRADGDGRAALCAASRRRVTRHPPARRIAVGGLADGALDAFVRARSRRPDVARGRRSTPVHARRQGSRRHEARPRTRGVFGAPIAARALVLIF